MWQNSKTQIVTKENKSSCDKTKNNQIVTESKTIFFYKTQIVTKLRNKNYDKTQIIKLWQN